MTASRILVGHDGTPHAEDAVALARILREASGAEVVLARVVPWEPLEVTSVPLHELRERYEEEERRALAELEDLAERVGATAMTRPGASPARGLNDLAEELDPEVVVVGSSQRGALGRVLAGNVALSLLNGLHRPLAVAPAGYSERPAKLETIGVAFDASSESYEALRTAAGLARASGARVEVIRVLAAGSDFMPSPWAFAWETGPARRDLERHARDRIEAALATLPRQVPGASRVEIGTPAVVLVDASDELDLLIVGSRGYGPLRRLLLGSTSRQLVSEAHCPVLVTPRTHSGEGG